MGQKLGQHFLKNDGVLKKIAEAADITPGDTVVEIGPGHGELTAHLLRCAGKKGRVIAIERDSALAEDLRKKFGDEPFELAEGDALKILPSLAADLKGGYILTGNIPYYLTGFLFRTVSELKNKPKRVIFTIQKEVAERIMALPPDMNRLSAAVRFWAKPRIICTISRKDFSPSPKTDSATIFLETQPETKDAKSYYAALSAVFRQPRKTILNNIAEATGLPKIEVARRLEKIGIDPTRRPQNIGVEEISGMGQELFA